MSEIAVPPAKIGHHSMHDLLYHIADIVNDINAKVDRIEHRQTSFHEWVHHLHCKGRETVVEIAETVTDKVATALSDDLTEILETIADRSPNEKIAQLDTLLTLVAGHIENLQYGDAKILLIKHGYLNGTK
jgi:NCAIR mutase (PurE)-related protein